ncbi:MAG TPA: DUF4375 domain-containing protein [Tepidisphaeraceae bacterium]|nr:DUF4375 domain-containing protein [Tepidisphaeraceae bacterium]
MANNFLIPKAKFTALIEDAEKSGASPEAAHKKVWFDLTNDLRSNWDGIDKSFWDSLTPGQYVVVCTSMMYRGIEQQDFVTLITAMSGVMARALKGLETLGADEYLQLFRQAEEACPGKKFPKHAEDMMRLPAKTYSYFEEIGKKIVKSEGMKRPLHEYVYEYVTKHPEEFCHS